MTTSCPNGHESATDDYCDQCGSLLIVAERDDVAAESQSTPIEPASLQHEPEPCVRCGTLRVDDDPFCENCGHQFGTEDAAPSWQVVIIADRDYYDRMAPPGVEFPGDPVHRVVALTEPEMLIGRLSRSRATFPEIDCSGPPEDPAISHRHALLVRDAAGNYAVCDLGSTNGTTINNDPKPIPKDVPVPLRDGDDIHVGAFTTLALRGSPSRTE
jgi:FHA domain-containing protein